MGVLCCHNETQLKVVFTAALPEKPLPQTHGPRAAVLPAKTAGRCKNNKPGSPREQKG